MKTRYHWGRAAARAVATCGILASAIFGWMLAGPATTVHAAQVPEGNRSVMEGIYTEEQATKRGRIVYRRCVLCHLPTGKGDSSLTPPPLPIFGDELWKRWEGKPLKELYEKVSTQMPQDNPGGLTPPQYLDALAYIFFQINKFPAGKKELTLEDLDQIVFTKVELPPPAAKTPAKPAKKSAKPAKKSAK